MAGDYYPNLWPWPLNWWNYGQYQPRIDSRAWCNQYFASIDTLLGRTNMGLAAQWATLKTDASTVAADAAKETADQTTETTDTTGFVAALGTGAIFVSADGTTADLVLPSNAAPGYTSTTYPVAS